ncbi:MAG: hypothetical protein MI974_34255 [Chitinophagales bacterium]|nr:hypothetical protein [Chitinophagales bacterium]
MQFTTRVLTKPSYLFIRKLLVVFIFIFVGSNVFAQPTNNLVGDVVMPSPTAASLGKYTDIPVSHFTGVPSISIPIYTVQEGSVSLPISISYHASGIKAVETASRVGTGWSLNAGGMISRTILSLPDEWEAGYLSVGGTLNGVTDSDEVFNVGEGTLDSEPDIFSYNFAGYSGKFFFTSNNSVIECHHVRRSDIDVDIKLNGNVIDGFILTTPDGNRYHFGTYSPSTGGSVTATEESDGLSLTGWYLLAVENHAENQVIELEYEDENYKYEYPSSCFKRDFEILANGCVATSGESCGGSISGTKTDTKILSKRVSAIRSSKEDVVFMAGTDRYDLDIHAGPRAKSLGSIEIASGDVICKRFNFPIVIL